ncbi:MAG: glycosyltransferase family 4 protein [Actinobacteria bacterium]|nr:glycosyltransferase family 4 protein [Actinomycetota bacterium]
MNLLWLVPGEVGGSEEYATRLLRAVAADRPAGIELDLFVLRPFLAAHPDLAEAFTIHVLPLAGRAKPVRVLAESTWLAAAARTARLDLVHHLGGVVPPVRGTPAVVTIHDLQPLDAPQSFSRTKLAYLRAVLPRTTRAARLVCGVSRFTCESVVRLLGIPPERVAVVPHGIDPALARPPESEVERVRRTYDLPGPWFLTPAITYPHKGHLTVVRAFRAVHASHPDARLVLAGGEGPAEAEVMAAVERLGLRDAVRRTGRVPRSDLDALFAGATALAFPSRYEGFGAPALEAMALGTPVVAARATALPEVVGDAGILVAPDAPDDWAAALMRLLEDPDLHRRLASAGRDRAATYSWDRAAGAQIDAWRRALAGAPGQGRRR